MARAELAPSQNCFYQAATNILFPDSSRGFFAAIGRSYIDVTIFVMLGCVFNYDYERGYNNNKWIIFIVLYQPLEEISYSFRQ